jgi:NADH-quinone oxidoreductase subunit M
MTYDAWLMTLVIFVPALFALFLCLPFIFPRGSEEYMRWWTLLGTAVTFVLSLWIFIDYERDVIDTFLNDRTSTTLGARVQKALDRVSKSEPQLSNDWVARYDWLPRFNIQYYLGLDGISLPLILLTTLISMLAMIASWNIERHVRGYCVLFLVLETGMIGTFLGLDFFLFFVFWEVMLLPMYFLIGIWGGPQREYAAIKFFLFTMLGSIFILIALLGFYFTDVRDFVDQRVVEQKAEQLYNENKSLGQEGAEDAVKINTFDLIVLQKVGKAATQILTGQPVENEGINRAQARLKEAEARGVKEQIDRWQKRLEACRKRLEQPFFTSSFQIIMFLLLFVGFAIKLPMFPFHTWLPDAHVEAPTPISMILAGILLKMGGYGFLRIAYPICPWAAEYLAWWICLFGVINIVYGAFAAMAQSDFKKLVAYSSISHMGYVLLGIAVWSATDKNNWSWGMNGAMFQMIAHGISSAGMFFLVGVIYDRAHHRNLDNFRGLYEPMPLYGGISAIIFFAALGLPGLCGFVGEFFVVLGTWNFRPSSMSSMAALTDSGRVFAVLAALTVVITAAYILWTLQRVLLGQNPAYKDLPEINLRELICIVPLVVLAVALGVWPPFLLSWMEPSVTGLVDLLAQVRK